MQETDLYVILTKKCMEIWKNYNKNKIYGKVLGVLASNVL